MFSDLLVTPGLTLRQWDGAAGSSEAICGGPRAGLSTVLTPHPDSSSTGRLLQRAFSGASPQAQTHRQATSHPALLFPLKCLFAGSFRT